jgi:hypothetical protein
MSEYVAGIVAVCQGDFNINRLPEDLKKRIEVFAEYYLRDI